MIFLVLLLFLLLFMEQTVQKKCFVKTSTQSKMCVLCTYKQPRRHSLCLQRNLSPYQNVKILFVCVYYNFILGDFEVCCLPICPPPRPPILPLSHSPPSVRHAAHHSRITEAHLVPCLSGPLDDERY